MVALNQAVFGAIHRFAGANPLVDVLGIFFAAWLPYFLAAAFLVLVFYQETARRRFYLFAEGALAVILSRGIVTTAIHYFYFHPRPFVFYGFAPLIGESGSSFPSGHMAWFFALAMTIWFTDRRWGWWFLLLTALMGIARIYAGVHWPYDILGGAAIGIASGVFVRWLLRDFRNGLTSAPPSASSRA